MFGNFMPTFKGNFPRVIQFDFSVNDLSKNTFPVLRANGDEIRPRQGIIGPLQSDGTAAVFFGVEFHSMPQDLIYTLCDIAQIPQLMRGINGFSLRSEP